MVMALTILHRQNDGYANGDKNKDVTNRSLRFEIGDQESDCLLQARKKMHGGRAFLNF